MKSSQMWCSKTNAILFTGVYTAKKYLFINQGGVLIKAEMLVK